MNDPFNQDDSTLNENTPISMPPREPALIGAPSIEQNSFDRTLWYTIGGIVLLSCCGILFLGYLFSQTPTFKEATTFNFDPIPTFTPGPTPDFPATQAAWVKPAQAPSLGSADEAYSALNDGYTSGLAYYAEYYPPMPDINMPGDIYDIDVRLGASTDALWSYGWCTLTPEILDQNFAQMKVDFILNGEPVSSRYVTSYDNMPQADYYCRDFAILITKWPAGTHRLESSVTFLKDTNDGWNVYPAGTHLFRYFVTAD